MTDADNQKVEASAYKGILPTHMRQGIPPYLQVLFAARPKLPSVPPIAKPHKMTFKGFNQGPDLNEARKKCLQLKAQREATNYELPDHSKRTLRPTLSKAHRSTTWKVKFANHMKEKKAEYRKWLTDKNNFNGNKTTDPKNTLIVSNLVIS